MAAPQPTDVSQALFLSIIQIFVAINVIGVLPIYIGLTGRMLSEARQKVARQSVVTAFLVTMGFVFLGQAVFTAIGIQVEDFMIAGGVLLLIISVVDMLRREEREIESSSSLGVVPLGMPLLAGPATLTTALLLVNTYGYLPVVISLVVNLLIAWVMLSRADVLIRLIGINGAQALAKVALLLLAAIAVRLIRSGVAEIIRG